MIYYTTISFEREKVNVIKNFMKYEIKYFTEKSLTLTDESSQRKQLLNKIIIRK